MTGILAAVIGCTSSAIVYASGTAAQPNIWKSTAVAVMAEHYGLSSSETAVLQSGAVKAGAEYTAAMPYANGTTEADLAVVDYQTKTVYVKAYGADGYTWEPSKAVLTAEGEEKEQISLTAGAVSYEDEQYDASGVFTYDGHSYTVTVTYELNVSIDRAEQERILSAPQILTQSVKCLEQNLKGSNINLSGLQEAVPYLNTLLYEQFPTEDGGTTAAFDSAKDADVIWAIRRMNTRCKDGKELGLYTLSESYKNSGSGRLSFAMEHGREVIDAAEEIKADLQTLRNSSSLATAISKVQKSNPELYSHVRSVPGILRSLAGTEKNPGTVVKLTDPDNWKILDESVRSQILKEDYDNVSLAKLEAAVYALRNKTLTVPQVDTESFCAGKAEVSCAVQLYDVTVTFTAQTVTGAVGDSSLQELTPKTETFTLPAGLTGEEVQAALRDTGEEQAVLKQWNSLDDSYLINVSNYERTESTLSGTLSGDIGDYTIRYVPRQYKVKTNFAGNMTVPYGYRLEFPANEDSETDYDYVAETSDGSRISYEQGSIYVVGADVTVKRTVGTKKQEYRLYDFLAEDTRYGFSEDVQWILKCRAIRSPWLKIRMPEEDASGEIETKGSTCTLKAQESGSGVSGMTWKPSAVVLMRNGKEVKRIAFDEQGVATWKKVENTNAVVRYELQITKVKRSLIGYETLTDEMVAEAVRMPELLVEDTCRQNRLLGGSTDSARSVYESMKNYTGYLTQSTLSMIEEAVTNPETKNAARILMTSENEKAEGVNGEDLGYGGFNADYDPDMRVQKEDKEINPSDTIALYRYLELSAGYDWSLIEAYVYGRYEKIAQQSKLVADCLSVIMEDPEVQSLAEKSSGLAKAREEILAAIPTLRKIAEGLTGPNTEWINTKDEDFPMLIAYLKSAEGKTGYTAGVTGIIAANTARKTSIDTGVLTVTVQVGSKKKSREITYLLPETDSGDRSHRFTEADLEQLQETVRELETACGITEEEKAYYGESSGGYPQVGDELGYSRAVSIVYTPNTYTVTVKGVSEKEFKKTFQYSSKGSFSIALDRKSPDTKAATCYRYTIDGKTIDVPNGSENGSYTFKKADLTTLFSNGNHYEIQREEIKATVTAEEKTDTKKEETKKEETKKETAKTAAAKTTEKQSKTDKTDTAADEAGNTKETDTENTELKETAPPEAEATDNEAASQTLKEQGQGGKKVSFHIPWWLLLLLALLILTGLGLLAWDLWRKHNWKKTSEEGAPLVNYDIEEDDSAETSAGGSDDGQ